MRASSFQKTIDLLKRKEGLLEYFRYYARNARSETDPVYQLRTPSAPTREAMLT